MARYDEIPAGPRLDALLAERVMGWRQGSINGPTNTRYWLSTTDAPLPCDEWAPSSDMADAWRVVESLTAIARTPSGVNTRFAVWWDHAHLWACSAQEAALEICRAALTIMDEAGLDELARLSQETGAYD